MRAVCLVCLLAAPARAACSDETAFSCRIGAKVQWRGTLPATLACDPGSVSTSLDMVADFKAGIGQRRDFDAKVWTGI